MEYEFFIKNEVKDLTNEQNKLNSHKKWIDIAIANKDKNINWRIYWSRYHHNEERYTPQEIIEKLEK